MVPLREELEKAAELIRAAVGKLIATLERECPNIDLASIGLHILGAVRQYAGDEDTPSDRDWVSTYLAEKLLFSLSDAVSLSDAARLRAVTATCSRLELVEVVLRHARGEDEENYAADLIEAALNTLRQRKLRPSIEDVIALLSRHSGAADA